MQTPKMYYIMRHMKTRTYKYKIEVTNEGITAFMNRYHFDEKDRELLIATARVLSELFFVETGICYREDKVVCAATLGEGYDRFSDVVEDAEHLLVAYSLECFAMDFLAKSYEKMNETVYRETGRWMGTYRFLGDGDLDRMQEYLKIFQNLNLRWEKGMLRPLKSVVFTAEYTDQREKSGCESCEQCRNVSCSFRRVVQSPGKKPPELKVKEGSAYPYGFARIFGK